MDCEDLMPCGDCCVCGEMVDHSESGGVHELWPQYRGHHLPAELDRIECEMRDRPAVSDRDLSELWRDGFYTALASVRLAVGL